MAKLTRDQVIKWNDGNKNEFRFDITYFLTHSEKTSIKHIEIDDNHVITVHLIYTDEMETKRNEYGCTWRVETGRQIPAAHFALALKERGYLISRGLGYWHTLGEARSDKNYQALNLAQIVLDR